MKESDYWAATLLSISTPLFILLIVIIGIFKECTDDTDPLDYYDGNAKQEYVEFLKIHDSNCNGFRVTYSTVNAVTKERLAEIQSRKHIIEAFKRLEKDAVSYFKDNMLYTDIYDFADFAKKYDVDKDIQIHCIFIDGVEKCNLYIGENKKWLKEKSATWFNVNTEQGTQWINRDDIYRNKGSKKTYRYWKCTNPLCGTSETDERFSHFSEDERIR